MIDFFISYNRNDESWAEWIAWVLKEARHSVILQKWHFMPGQDFVLQMQNAAIEAKHTIAVLSKHYLNAEFTQPEWTSAFARDPKGVERTLIPVRIAPVERAGLWKTRIDIDLVGLDEDAAKAALLRGISETGEPATAPSFPRSAPQPTFPGPTISISHLPSAGEFLLGRESELQQLNDAWDNPRVHVITIVARGGEGKTNLVRHWLNHMAADGWRGAEKVFAWSFYSQGTSDKAASADQFIDAAMQFLGLGPAESIKSPHMRGERLATVVGGGRNLLLLDGLEPLQYPPGPMRGRLKDPALGTLIAGLSAQNHGLCVITTRESLPELASGKTNLSPEIDLPPLTDHAGAELMKNLRVGGSDAQRESVARRLRGHAIAIQLLGTYLFEVFDGDVTRAGDVALLDQEGADHARHIFESYEKWLSEDVSGRRLLAVLRLLGLFDRPVPFERIELLRDAAIPALTDVIADLSHADWKRALTRLREMQLIDADAAMLDAHPLVREYFAVELEKRFSDAAREAHRLLYEHLKATAPQLPETLADMAPLFEAIVHGCKAQLADEALIEVFYSRVLRDGNTEFAVRKLGAIGATIGCLTVFFKASWSDIDARLTAQNRSYVLGEAGHLLRMIGSARDAAELLSLSIEQSILGYDWLNTAISAVNLCDVTLLVGNVASAVRSSERAVEFADRSEDRFWRGTARVQLATAFYLSARFEAAHAAFADAVGVQTKMLTYFAAFNHWSFICDVAPAKMKAIRQLAEHQLQMATQHRHLLDIGLLHLILATVALRLSTDDSLFGHDRAPSHMEEAVRFIREAGSIDELPQPLIRRAEMHRTFGEFDLAAKDLAEAEQIASQGGMVRWQIEGGLERLRLDLAIAKANQADATPLRKKLKGLRALVKSTDRPYIPHEPTWEEWKPPSYIGTFKKGDIVGYHRADREIAAFEKDLEEFMQQA